MRRLRYLVFLPGSAALGQIQDLATNQDGSVLLFASTLRQPGADQSRHWKLFRWSQDGGVQLYARRECLPDGMLTTFCALRMPSLSPDADFAAFSAARSCSFVSSGGATLCDTYETVEGIVRTRDGTEALRNAGWMQLTPGGRYAVSAPKCPASANQCLDGNYDSRLIFDPRAPGEPPIRIGRRFDASQVADSGALIEARGCGLAALSDIHNRQPAREFPVSGCVSRLMIAPDGNTAVYETLLSDYGHFTPSIPLT
ncbi:MAG: hypothetical protein IT166_12970 [Bryobacterales bacterium]|nr:hypothetical protein [Bryobacterales bacterium]